MPDEIENPEPKSGAGWPLAVALMVVALGGMALAGFVFKSCLNQPAQLAERVAAAARPTINIQTIIQTSLERLKEESKLVVYTADVAVMITKFSEKKVLYGKVDLGTTTVRLRASGNKAQFIIPLEKLAAANFRFDESAQTLTVKLPPPRVDETLVEVQTDPAFYEVQTEVGWARLESYSGDFLREQARRDLRPAVIAEVSHPRLVESAQQSCREKIAALLAAAIVPVHPEVKVAVEFEPAQE